MRWCKQWKGLPGPCRWCAEVVCPLNRLLRFTACNSVIEFCKKWKASWDNTGEHLECSDEWPHSGNGVSSGHEARAAMRWGLALRVPEFQTQPSIVVDWGLMIVLDAERQRSHLCRACKTFFQFDGSSLEEFPPQYRSSAILATIPSFNKSPSTRLMSSLRAVLEPGMPMADRAYTHTPRNGVESRERGIW